jgi:hemoglobin
MDVTKVLLVILALALAYLVFSRCNEGGTHPKSLYERLGGIYAIAAVVDRFSDELIKNPIVGKESPNPALKKWSNDQLSRLPGLKWLRTLWVSDIAGGPYRFHGTKGANTNSNACPFSGRPGRLNLAAAHKDFHITSDEFDEVASELTKALDHYKVPEKEKGEVLAAFAAHKREVVGG